MDPEPDRCGERPPTEQNLMSRLNIRKTYKLYIGGKFPRTESGRTVPLTGKGGEVLAQVSRASRKDLRNAVEVARKSQGRMGLGQRLPPRADPLPHRRDAGRTPGAVPGGITA